MKKVRLGIIGMGYIGQIHLRHASKIANAQVLAVSDVSKKALFRAEKAGVKKTFSTYEQLLRDPEIDAVIIALPTHLHLECAKQAAEAKKHIFLEKPIARNVEEAQKIISATEKNSVKLMMGYPLRFNTQFQTLKKRMMQRTLGDVEIAYASFISSGPFFHRAEGYAPTPVPEWWFNKELTGGGVLIDMGSHIINLLRWYFGEVKEIKARFGYRFKMDFEDSALCLARFETGTVGVINVGWFSQQYQLKLELLGSVGHAIMDHRPSSTLSTAVQMFSLGISKFYHPHYSELQYFVDCLIKDNPPSPSGQDGLRDLEAITKAYANKIDL